jgi:hypothetical protein
MKTSLISALVFSLTLLLFSCKEGVISPSKEPVASIKVKEPSPVDAPLPIVNPGFSGNGNLIAKYHFKAFVQSKISREFILDFKYDIKGNLVSIYRTDNHISSQTGEKIGESHTNRTIMYSSEGVPSQLNTITDEGLKYNSVGIYKYTFMEGHLMTAKLFIEKDNVLLPFPVGDFNFVYNAKNQLTSYINGGEERHKYGYLNNTHSTTNWKGISDFDFEYGKVRNPNDGFNSSLKFIIFQALEDDPSKGFGLTSKTLPNKIINKSGGGYNTLEYTVNQENLPTKIVGKNYIPNFSTYFANSITEIDYIVF